MISIHAPREGSDNRRRMQGQGACHFNPRSPRGERRDRLNTLQSVTRANFNPRSPRGERLTVPNCYPVALRISIHAPREGSDSNTCKEVINDLKFQSTLPARGATIKGLRTLYIIHISIHAPREGSDVVLPSLCVLFLIFQSTLPARGATVWCSSGYCNY